MAEAFAGEMAAGMGGSGGGGGGGGMPGGGGAGMPMLGTGMQAIGQLLGGIGAFTASRAKAKALGYAAQQARQEAGVNSGMALSSGDRAIARGATIAAANGGGLAGSAGAVLQDLAQQAMYNARVATYQGETEAQNDLYQAKVAKAQGNLQLVSSVLGAGGTVMGGAAQNAADRRSALANQQLHGYGRPGVGLPDYGYQQGGY